MGNLTLLCEVKSGTGYASSSMIPVHFGLGNATAADRLEILWPGGRVQVLEDVPANRAIRVREGRPGWERFYGGS